VSIPADIFDRLQAQPYGAIRPQVRDGDVLLCSADDRFSRLIRWGASSPWSHVAIAFQMPAIDRVMVLECVEKLGVRALPLSMFITKTSSGVQPYPGRILLARHAALAEMAGPGPLRQLAEFAFGRLGDPFSRIEMAKIVVRIVLGRFDVKLHPVLGPKDEFICSEFVARCFQAVGIEIPWDGLGFIGPGDIAADPRLEAVAQIQT